jgi:chromosome partitioning protein
MQTITLLNEKGGVGKTTLSMTLATGLAIKGHRVLLIDGDSQGHISVSLRLKPKDGLFRLLAQEAAWKDVVVTPDPASWRGTHTDAPNGSLWILPGNATTVAIPTVVTEGGLLRERLDELDGYVDIVVIDTAPQLGMMHTIFYLATHHLIHPVECERFAVNALGRSTKHADQMNKDRAVYSLPPVHLVGIVPNMYRGNTVTHQQGLEYIKNELGHDNILSPIGLRAAWSEASYAGQSIFAAGKGTEAEREAWTMVNEVSDRIEA